MTPIANTPNPEGFFIFNGKTISYNLAFNSILRLEATRFYTVIHLKEKPFVVCSKNIGAIEEIFRKAGFFRIHRSHMVNMNEVVTFEKRQVLLSDDTSLFVSHLNISEFLKVYCEIKNLPQRRRSRTMRRVG